jgi:uncharacterized protein (TIGR02246 family)
MSAGLPVRGKDVDTFARRVLPRDPYATRTVGSTSRNQDRFAMTDTADSYALTTDLDKVTELYVRAFNSGDPAIVNRLYTDDALSVWEPGKAVSGEARVQELVAGLAQRPVMRATLRHHYAAGDTAMLVVDWEIDVTAPDGTVEEHRGVGLDVVVRGADGYWRFAIDNPYEKAN